MFWVIHSFPVGSCVADCAWLKYKDPGGLIDTYVLQGPVPGL
jgi:hypothetical protein